MEHNSIVLPIKYTPLKKKAPLLNGLKRNMKYLLALVLAVVLVAVTGCQYAKTSVAVMDSPKFISEHYDNFDKLNVDFNADVIVPVAHAYPVIDVEGISFSEKQINEYISIVAGQNFELYSKWDLTKSEWEQKLDAAKQYQGTGRVTPKLLDYLQNKIKSSSSHVENPLVHIPDIPAGELTQVFVKNNDMLSTVSFIKRGNTFAYFRDIDSNIIGKGMYDSIATEQSAEDFKKNEWLMPGEPDISKEGAYEKALNYINMMEIGLDLYYAEPCTIITDYVNKKTGWAFTFTRTIGELQSQFIDGQWSYVNPDALPSVGAPWAQEACVIVIDSDGLCKLWWQGASSVKEIVTESAQLIQFESIKDTLVNQLNDVYGTHTNESGNGLKIKINKLELGTSLIALRGREGEGQYVPTWYADFNYNWLDKEETNSNLGTGQMMLNAVTGEYIEPRIEDEKIVKLS